MRQQSFNQGLRLGTLAVGKPQPSTIQPRPCAFRGLGAIHPPDPIAWKAQALQRLPPYRGVRTVRHQLDGTATQWPRFAAQALPSVQGTGHAGTAQSSPDVIVATDDRRYRGGNMSLVAGAQALRENRIHDGYI